MTKKKIILITIAIILTAVAVLSLSYAIWNITLKQTNNNQVVSDCFHIDLKENTENISLQKAYPMTDKEGSYLTPYEFEIQNQCQNYINYEIQLEVLNTSTLSSEHLKVMVNEMTPELLNTKETRIPTLSNASTSYKIGSGTLGKEETKSYTLRIWIDEGVTPETEGVQNTKWSSKVTVTASYDQNQNYRETILNGTDPVLKDSLIPITLESDGTVKKANTNEKWYSYENQSWANAVILKDEGITYQNNEVIPESNIESYFVWIPRYKYKIFNEGLYTTRTEIDTSKAQTIEVVFETKDTPVSTGSTLGTWLTHPAFTTFNSNGMWVGKYETGKSSGSDNVIAPEQIQIKPNVVSWKNIQVANAFYTSFDYKRELDSHMMKNTEWGAVAYLSHSAYGSRQSVRFNNNYNYLTGYAANEEPTCGYTETNEECNRYCKDASCYKTYNSNIGHLASTTANITGIYDMAGGAWEYVMGIMLDEIGNPMSGRNSFYNSGFNGTLGCPVCDSDTSEVTSITNGYSWPEKKYYDSYTYSSSQYFNSRILGDATGEMGPFGDITYLTQTRAIGSWYADQATFVTSGNPWFIRGSSLNAGSDSGIFAFSIANGRFLGYISFRIVLTP